jgi:hypothetical protein
MNVDASALGWKALEVLSPLLIAGLSWLALKATQLITAKVKNEYLRGVLVRLDDAVLVAVREVQQVTVDGLKAASADGQLTPEERAKVKETALSTIKSHLGAKGLAEVANILGLENGTLDKLLSTRVEAAVHDLKAARTTLGRERRATPSLSRLERGAGPRRLAQAWTRAAQPLRHRRRAVPRRRRRLYAPHVARVVGVRSGLGRPAEHVHRVAPRRWRPGRPSLALVMSSLGADSARVVDDRRADVEHQLDLGRAQPKREPQQPVDHLIFRVGAIM